MSAAATAAVTITQGYSQVPNSFIENQWLFTAAERSMLLAVMRRQNNNGGRSITIPDETWTRWTGLEPRTKEAAIAGLRNKGLVVVGRGDSARYNFARDQWERFIRNKAATESYKPRTAGRGVNPEPGAKIHPECRAGGCRKLQEAYRDENEASPLFGQNESSPLFVIPLAQPVAQTPVKNDATQSKRRQAENRSGPLLGQNDSSPLPSSPLAQPVAQTPVKNDATQSKRRQAENRSGPLLGQNDSSPLPSSPLAQPVAQTPVKIQSFLGIFISLAVPMSDRDLTRCKSLWSGLSPSARRAAYDDARAKIDEWKSRASNYVPRPWNYLANAEWERRAVVAPRKTNETRTERAAREETDEFFRLNPDIK
jgi:hypothetical protein